MAAEKLLRETLNDLSSEEFNKFKSLVELEESFSAISRSRLEVANKEDVVELMMEAHDQPQWVEVTRKVLKKMNRPDLVRRLSEDSSGIKETQQPTLTQRVETMTSVIELLLETLSDLTGIENLSVIEDLLRQIYIHSLYSAGRSRLRQMTDIEDTVFLMVKTCGQESVMKTMEVLKNIKRTDLVQRLSDRSSISKKKHSDDNYSSALIHKVATMAAVKELLMETLNILKYKELEKFKLLLQFTQFQRGPSHFPWRRLMTTNRVEIADLMMEQYGHQSVEVTIEVLMDMNRMDLVQKLPETSLELEESSTETIDVKITGEEHSFALIQGVETMTSVIEQLLETLADFKTIVHFKELVLSQIYHQRPYNHWRLLELTDLQDCVFVMVETYGQQSVKKIKEILEKMKKTDFVQRLSDSKLRPQKKMTVDKPPAALIHKVATMAAVKQLLLETLNDLSNEEFRIFKKFLQLSYSQKDLIHTLLLLRQTVDRAEVVDVMVEAHGQQSVEVTKQIFMKMNRTDVVKQFSGTSSRLKETLFWYDPGSVLFERVPATDAVEKILVGTLRSLSNKELRKFKWSLQFMYFQKGIPQIPGDQEELADRTHILHNLRKRHGQQSVEVMMEVFKDMNRTDLVERLSKTSSRSKEKKSVGEDLSEQIQRENVPLKRSDPVLSDTSSGLQEKHSVDEQQPALVHKVETLAYIIKLLLDILADLSDPELEDFKQIFRSQVHHHKTWLLMMADIQQTVFVMVQTYGQESMEKTKEILEKVKRTDLVQRLSKRNRGSKKKHSVDIHLSALINKVATVRAVKELLLEILNGLSHKELKKFKWLLQFMYLLKGLPYTQWKRLQRAGGAEIVDLMVEVSGQQSVKVTLEVFMDMNRTDLVQRLSESSSGFRAAESSTEAFKVEATEEEKDEFCSALIEKVEVMTSVIELLLEALADLSDMEIEDFKHVLLGQIHKPLSDTIWKPLDITDVQDAVFFMVDTYGQQSVEMIKNLLSKMNQTDLVQKLSDSSSAPKQRFSVAVHCSALIQKVATMAAVRQLLLETVNSLSYEELKKFKEFLGFAGSQWDLTPISWTLTHTEDSVDVVDLMVQTYGQQSVEVTKKIFMNMKRTDLVQKLSESGSGSKEEAGVDKHGPAQFERAAATDAVKKILLKTLNILSHAELEKFKWLLQFTYFQKGLSQIPQTQLELADTTAKLVDLVVERDGQQSLEVTREVLMDMNRPDLAGMFSETCSTSKEKHQSSLFHKQELAMTSVKTVKILLQTLEDLSYGELQEFKWVLQHTETKTDLPRISRHNMEMADRFDMVDLMVWTYGQQCVEVTREVLKKINRIDLVQRLPDTSPAFKGPSRSLEVGNSGGCLDSSDWTKLEPEVNRTDTDEDPTYSLQSEMGTFECSISGLRWSCKAKVCFKYQFLSWEEHMERMENMQYVPVGPLIDITVDAGKLENVYLPHWICIDDNPRILDKFAVLHIDDCGDVVEKASEVTSSHVKLSEPVFSPRAVLMKAGFPVKINCNVLIYKINTAFLTLHVYLIPRDPGLQQVMKRRESSYEYKVIRKPHPVQSLKMLDRFILTTDLDGAEICPEYLKLRYESSDPNFFEIFIKNPDSDFTLSLTQKNVLQPAWSRVIRKDEYQSSGQIQDFRKRDTQRQIKTIGIGRYHQPKQSGRHFVDTHRCELINRVRNIGPVLDNLLSERVIQQEDYDQIRVIPTPQEKMRNLYVGPLNAGGREVQDIFYKILKEKEPYLIEELNRKEA